MQNRFCLELNDAKRIAEAARQTAEANQWNVVISILDEGGHLVYLERMDGTQRGSIVVSQEKAKTAYLFNRPTKKLEEAIAGGRTVMLKLTGSTPIEGGLPLIYQNQLVGAIGISGVQSFQDGIIAQAGADYLATL
ncbi:MAG: heme-binding protein [Betaproteobacteria bacterium]|nr:heme-binding protein [Betaproteobacteria bacterium]